MPRSVSSRLAGDGTVGVEPVPEYQGTRLRDQNRFRVHRPVIREADASAKSGRGLMMVSTLTSGRWGWQESSGGPGKVVWAGPARGRPASMTAPRQTAYGTGALDVRGIAHSLKWCYSGEPVPVMSS